MNYKSLFSISAAIAGCLALGGAAAVAAGTHSVMVPRPNMGRLAVPVIRNQSVIHGVSSNSSEGSGKAIQSNSSEGSGKAIQSNSSEGSGKVN